MDQVGIEGGHGHIPSMQVTWHRLTSPILSHRRLPCKVWRKCPKLYRFQYSAEKGATKWMVELLEIVHRLVGIGAYAKTALEGATYCPVFIQLAFKSGAPEC